MNNHDLKKAVRTVKRALSLCYVDAYNARHSRLTEGSYDFDEWIPEVSRKADGFITAHDAAILVHQFDRPGACSRHQIDRLVKLVNLIKQSEENE